MLMQRALSRGGGLDGSRNYPDPKNLLSTLPDRETIKHAITKWLPSVSETGDTVVIFFSGHGSAIPASKKGNASLPYLVTCDTVDFAGLLAMRKLKEQKKLDPDHEKRLDSLERCLDAKELSFDPFGEAWKAMNKEDRIELLERVNTVLIEKTALTQNELSRWLQDLPGRRIIVILDACMSGGFANQSASGETKGLFLDEVFKTATDPRDFQFLKEQLGRLKDLGDVNTALLTAARADQASLQGHLKRATGQTMLPASIAWNDLYRELTGNEILVESGLISKEPPAEKETIGVFTYYMAQTLLAATGPMDVDHAGAECAAGMQQYFKSGAFQSWAQKINLELKKLKRSPLEPHSPVYFDHCQPKALLRP
jgi:hypothetical protein